MPDILPKLFSPSDLDNTSLSASWDLGRFEKKMLAQGDSWFSIGHLPPWSTTNIPEQLVLSTYSCIVNCAHPGEELAHMTSQLSQPWFVRQLTGNAASRWNVILLSGGGNDLIDAAQVGPGADLGLRLLRTAAEWSGSGPDRYISEDGWKTFADHIDKVFDEFVALRDSKPVNRGVPVVFHSYDRAVPRDAPAGPGAGPWLHKAFETYAIPIEDRIALAYRLLDRQRDLMKAVVAKADRNLHLVDTLDTIVPADPDSTGVSGDWENEIHPTPHGYSRLAAKWRPVVESLW